MDCPPPIVWTCEVIKNDVKLVSIPCTVAYFCPDKVKTFDDLVMSDKVKVERLLKNDKPR